MALLTFTFKMEPPGKFQKFICISDGKFIRGNFMIFQLKNYCGELRQKTKTKDARGFLRCGNLFQNFGGNKRPKKKKGHWGFEKASFKD